MGSYGLRNSFRRLKHDQLMAWRMHIELYDVKTCSHHSLH